MKKLCSVFAAILMFAAGTSCFAQEVKDIDFELEAEVLMKKSDLNPTKFAWRNVLYAENVVIEGSSEEFIIKTVNAKKGYTGFSLFQDGSELKPVAVNTNGKEQKIIPGKCFTKKDGLVWLSFTAPDKKKYCLPTDIKVILPEDAELKEEVFEDDETGIIYREDDLITDYLEVFEEELSVEPEVEYSPDFDFVFLRDASFLPDNGEPVAEFAGLSKQTVEKKTNIQTVVKNLPEGTKPQIFFMNGLEVLVYIGPDLSLKSDDNCFTLFYSTRRYGRDEDFSQPKRVIENPKINGKLTNMLDFSGSVATVAGKQKLVVVWTQATIQQSEETTDEDLLKKTAIYWSSWKENDDKWAKPEVISDLKGSLQFDPVLRNSEKGLVLKFRNRPDNTFFTIDENPAFEEKHFCMIMNKKGVWESTGISDFPSYETAYTFSDKNHVVPEKVEYVFNRAGELGGSMWNDGTQVYAKTYMKSPDTKKMIWTESVPVIHQKEEFKVLNPKAFVRDTGEWILTFILDTSKGYNLCVARVNNEPCIVTKNMSVDTKDLQKPGNAVHFTVEVENLGFGIANGLDLVIKNEFKTEAGKITYKDNFYPGTTYVLNGIYNKLKGKDEIVPVEDIKADIKLPKMKLNSEFAYYNAQYTLGIPKFNFGDIFVTTKGKSQKVTYTVGTSNGVKVKAPATEVIVTEHAKGYEDNIEIVAVDYDFSDNYAELTFDYETSEFEEKAFDFLAYIHYIPERCKVPGWDVKDVEVISAADTSVTIYNPLFVKPSHYKLLTGSSFAKKTKEMTCEFVISNNWPEFISETVVLNLVNVLTGETEQTVELQCDLDVLQNKKYTVVFEPALSDKAEEYTVVIAEN